MRRAPRNSLLLTLAIILAAAAPRKEHASRAQLEQAERERAAEQSAQQQAAARATAAAVEADRLAQQRVAAAVKLRAAEHATETAADRMAELERQRRATAADLADRARTMQPLLPVIERLSLYPAETLLAVPGSPEDTMRGVIVLQGLVRQLQQDSTALRQAQTALEAATTAVAAQGPTLAAAETAQRQQEAALDAQIVTARNDQQQAQADADAAAARAADQAARADTLRAMVEKLDTERQGEARRAHEEAVRAARDKQAGKAAAAREREAALAAPVTGGTLASASVPKGQLTAPVAGHVFRSWGDPTDAGPATGISYHAAPSARVVSPCGGLVSFAEQFRSYGLLMIVDCGGGYHAVLNGFERLDVKAGQQVRAGEPVGVMPGWDPGSAKRPALNIELRHGSQPVNPAPWLNATS
jgi:septal ring factor EnvC (AmiA/AmiB activator)